MKTRKAMFETNSSSCHTCVIDDSAEIYDTLHVTDDGAVYIQFGEYGWEPHNYSSVQDRASYALTLACTADSQENLDMFNEVVLYHTGADHIVYVSSNGMSNEKDPLVLIESDNNGYVDGQSVHDMSRKIFADKITLKNFIFNPKSSFQTDNDN